MVSPTDGTLQHASVNGGVAVDILLADVSWAWKNITKSAPVEGKYDISEVEQGGFENPKLELTGYIDTDSNASNTLTQALLMDFLQADNTTNKTTLTITCVGEDETAEYLKGRPSAGYSIGGAYTNSLKVQLETASLKFGTMSSKEGRVWTYKLTMTEST